MDDIIVKYKKEYIDLLNYETELLNILKKNNDYSKETLKLINRSLYLIVDTKEIYKQNIENAIRDINKVSDLINENNNLEFKLKNRYV